MTAPTTLLDKIAFSGFLVLTASIAVQKPSIIAIAGKELSATDIIFPGVFLVWIASYLLGTRSFRWKPIYWLFAAYVLSFAISAIFAEDRVQAFVKTSSTAYLVFIAVVALEIVDSAARLKLSILTFLAASAIPVLTGSASLALFYISPSSALLPFLTSHYGAVPVGNYPRLSSTFVSASMFCNYLNVLLMLFLVARARTWIGSKLFLAGFATALACAVFTISSGLGAVLLALGIWYWNSRSSTVPGRLALTAGVAASLLFFATGFVALQKHATAPYSFHIPVIGTEAYPSPRLLVWTEAVHKVLDNFPIGKGPGTQSAAVMFQNSEGDYSLLTDAHNSFLSVATQTGVFGLLALISLAAYFVWTGFRIRDDVLVFGLAVAFLTGFVIQGLMGSFEDARHLWFLIGLLAAALQIGKKALPA